MIWALLAAFTAGFAIAAQAPVNARLAAHLGNGVAAAALSFGVGFLVLVLLTLARGDLPPLGRLSGIPWWAWLGGICGAIFVFGSLWSVNTLGVVTLVAVLVLGQMCAALLIDAMGAFGTAVHDVSVPRILAVVLVAAGVVLSRL